MGKKIDNCCEANAVTAQKCLLQARLFAENMGQKACLTCSACCFHFISIAMERKEICRTPRMRCRDLEKWLFATEICRE